METPTSSRWLELPNDILTCVFERLSFVDFHRAKIVCQNWYMCSKQTLPKQNTSPWLILFPEDGDSSCALYNAEEARVYKNKRDFSGTRFLANSGNWFLVLDNKSNLYIIDLFSEKTIHLPPLVSIKGGHVHLEQLGDNEFKQIIKHQSTLTIEKAKHLRSLLWVDEKKEEYVVVWYFTNEYNSAIKYLAFCKNGEDHYREIPTRTSVSDMVLRHGGDSLYVLTPGREILKLDLSGQEVASKNGYDISSLPFCLPLRGYKYTRDAKRSLNIAFTRSGEVLYVMSVFYESTRRRIFRVYKKDPNPNPHLDDTVCHRLVVVRSIGDEALILDSGVTVPANPTLGIEPNSIYFTRHDRMCYQKRSCPDVCVFNLATNTLQRSFKGLSDLTMLKDARWFLPS